MTLINLTTLNLIEKVVYENQDEWDSIQHLNENRHLVERLVAAYVFTLWMSYHVDHLSTKF